MRVRVGRIWGVASEAFMLAAPDWNTTTLARKRIRKNAEASRPGQFMYTSLLEAIRSEYGGWHLKLLCWQRQTGTPPHWREKGSERMQRPPGPDNSCTRLCLKLSAVTCTHLKWKIHTPAATGLPPMPEAQSPEFRRSDNI